MPLLLAKSRKLLILITFGPPTKLVREKMNYILAATIFISLSAPALALDADDFSELEGYTVTAITRVDGDFEGCEYDKKIKLQNGWVLSCQTYNYHYAYAPTVAVLTNDAGRGYLIKAIIDDDIYDMQPIAK